MCPVWLDAHTYLMYAYLPTYILTELCCNQVSSQVPLNIQQHKLEPNMIWYDVMSPLLIIIGVWYVCKCGGMYITNPSQQSAILDALASVVPEID